LGAGRQRNLITFATRLCGELGDVVVAAGGFGLLVFLLAPHCFLAARGCSASCVRTTLVRFWEMRAGDAASAEAVPLDVPGNRSPNGRRAPLGLWVRLKQPEAGSKPMVDAAGAAWSSSSVASIHAS
jgi:hypothetical protein